LLTQAQEDLFSFEDSGRQSRLSWGWSGSQAERDDLVDELRYMRDTGAITPSLLDPRATDADGSFTPSAEGLFNNCVNQHPHTSPAY